MLLTSCTKERTWQLESSKKIEGVNAIGLAADGDDLWLSDGDHNRLVKISTAGEILETIDSLERPMHISISEKGVFVPEYGKDTIEIFKEDQRDFVKLTDSLDAPAGVWVKDDEIAIADFYNHRILYSDGNEWISFGEEGKENGQFYYPTDVQITDNAIWVADAYNNRIQVFDKAGKYQKTFGESLKMNASTGMFVSDDALFITDFENDRVLILDHEGVLKQEIKDSISKPTDVIVNNDVMYIVNYKSGKLNTYKKQ
tara:strand:+ start:8681 stop:9451 length:771 start_codon:yes stop_codon:yes gene_type:complete